MDEMTLPTEPRLEKVPYRASHIGSSTTSKIILPGGSGYLGQALADSFIQEGREVIILSRKPAPSRGLCRTVVWDGKTLGSWAEELENAEAVINLAGRSVNCRYNAKNRQEIADSRLDATLVLGEAMARLQAPPELWLNVTSATIYRHSEEMPMDETTGEIGTGFSVEVCKQWEKTLFEAEAPVRKIALRTGMVFGRGKEGVCGAFYHLVKRGLGGTLGSGQQKVSWIHLEDFCRSIHWLIDHRDLSGAINATSPEPVPNRLFMEIFRQEVGVKIGLPASQWMLEVGVLFMQTETELLLKSRYVVPARLLQSGFTFQYPSVRSALHAILHHPQGHDFD